ARVLNPPLRESAVIMLISPSANGLVTVLIKRTNRGDVHGGQLAFPGGKLEAGESHQEAAWRELEEEIGVRHHEIQVLGELSPIYIPPSHFVVQPFVAWMEELPQWQLQTSEIEEVLIAPLIQFSAHFKEERLISRKNGENWRVMGYPVGKHFLWGATGMMVNEFMQRMSYLENSSTR
ncbi:MAG: NUDIX hydrolase, partial [Flavobacteriales bacterium]